MCSDDIAKSPTHIKVLAPVVASYYSRGHTRGTPPAPGVVGSQQQIANGHVQQHDKTGTGGKGPTGPQGPGRIEKGRAVPAGL